MCECVIVDCACLLCVRVDVSVRVHVCARACSVCVCVRIKACVFVCEPSGPKLSVALNNYHLLKPHRLALALKE